MSKKRCSWCSDTNDLMIEYHDNEWGVLRTDDNYLFEMLVLESFQAGLSWDGILKKRENFREAFDNFDRFLIMKYDESKLEELRNNEGIIRNRLKIKATVNNAVAFDEIVNEFGCFYNYLKNFTNGKIIYECGEVSSNLSDKISLNLKKRGMKFVGTVIIYSYLQAIGIINSHDEDCFKFNL